MRSTEMYTGELRSGHPQFPDGSEAGCVDNSNAATVECDPRYTDEDDKAIEEFLRHNIGSTWHSLGTTKMAAFNEDGVVDPLLNVYGVQGLKVCDLGIAPSMVAANTCNTAYTIGEKGADILIKELTLVK